jgi:hypothetical protein
MNARTASAITLALVVPFTAVVIAAEPAARPLPAETVTFDGQTLHLCWQGDIPGGEAREFVPAGERPDAWTRLASIRTYAGEQDPKALAVSLVTGVKAESPQAPCSIRQDAKTGDVLVDYVFWPADNSSVEFNVFRFAKAAGDGVVAHQYAIREHRDPKGFIEELRPVRERLLGAMAAGLGPVRTAAADKPAAR